MTRTPRIAGLGLVAGILVAACGGAATPSAPADTAPPATPAATALSTPTATPAPSSTPTPALTTTPAPTPGVDAAAGRAALDAFAALRKDPALSYRMEQTGSFAGTAGSSLFRYDIEISGKDFAAAVTVSGATIEMRGIGSTLYVKGPGKAWESGALDPATVADIIDVWRYLGPLEDLVLAGRATDPSSAFEFRNSGPLDYQTGPMRDAGVKGTITNLTFVVMPDGTPVAFDFDAESPDGQGGSLAITSRIAFSKVGDPVKITAPVP